MQNTKAICKIHFPPESNILGISPPPQHVVFTYVHLLSQECFLPQRTKSLMFVA